MCVFFVMYFLLWNSIETTLDDAKRGITDNVSSATLPSPSTSSA